MMSQTNSTRLIFAIVLLTMSLPIAPVFGQGKGNGNGNGGGNGGGGGGDPGLEFVELDAGTYETAAFAINNSGIVVGVLDGIAGTWNANDPTPTFEPLAASGFGAAESINKLGEIVGAVLDQPAYWEHRTANAIALPLPVGFDEGEATDISADGVVVGNARTAVFSAAVAWRVKDGVVFGPVVLSPTLGGVNGVASLGNGVNRAVGESQNEFGFNVATAWDIEVFADGSFEVTGTTSLIPDRGSRAYAITELGDICGIVDQTSGWPEAFVIRDQILRELPSGRRSESWARDLNNFEVVGATGRKYRPQDAARWNSRNKLEDITTIFGAAWSQSEAIGTNDLGEVVGVGDKGDTGTRTAWLLRVKLDP